MLGDDKDFCSARIAYKLGLTGPAIAVQSACSSSLVAVHQACGALAFGDADAAIVGGVSVSIPQMRGYLYQEGGVLSPTGQCRPFDAASNGTLKGNGGGVVVLRRLDDASADGDPILGVISGSAVNNDGRDRMGFTAPSVQGQQQVIESCAGARRVRCRRRAIHRNTWNWERNWVIPSSSVPWPVFTTQGRKGTRRATSGRSNPVTGISTRPLASWA